MLALIEPTNMIAFDDRPHLGCAMLIAACQEKGIKTTLINGQTRYLKDMFVNNSEELWNLIQDLNDNDLKKIKIAEYKKFIQEKGIEQFQDELESLYQNVIIDKNPRQYFNARTIEKFNNLYHIFVVTYFYYLKELNYGKLRIIDRYISDIVKNNFRYVGFSLEGFGPLSRTIRKRIKELTGMPIIVGGSLTPFIDFKKLGQTFKEEYFDYLIIGAGEHALPSLIEAIENNKEPKGIPNVFYKKNGEIKINDLETINNLDDLPYPDYSQFDLDLYLTPKRILPLQTARGCSWGKCAFCSHHNIDFGHYKTFGIEKVIETIKHLQNTYSCYHFAFHDEELPPGRAKRISEAILNNKLKNICINTYARLVDGYTNNLLRLMRKAGFTLIHWGMESGCQRVLNLMNKGTKISTASKILKESSKNKIANLCFIMFGFPGETKKEAQQTVEFLKKHADDIEDIMIGDFNLRPHSPLGESPEKWGIYIKTDGSYSIKSGMIPKEFNAFSLKFDKEFKINSIKVTSDKLKYLLPGFNRRMLHFLNSSHNLLSKTISLGYLKKGRLNSIFPIILGEVKKKGSRTIFLPINTDETTYINQYFPVKEITLDSLKKKILILSNGTLSIENIILTICKDFERRHRKEYIYKKCLGFFQDVFSKNWGLAFAKSWRPS